MSTGRTLVLTSLSSFKGGVGRRRRGAITPFISFQNLPSIPLTLCFRSLPFQNQSPSLSIPSYSFSHAAAPKESSSEDDSSSKDTVEELLDNADDVSRLMKMERISQSDTAGRYDVAAAPVKGRRWFPYLDMFRSGSMWLTSREVIDALDPYIMDVRKERIRRVVENRTYSVCLVVEGLVDFGNVSAVFRSADALGFQSVHVISRDSAKRCIEF